MHIYATRKIYVPVLIHLITTCRTPDSSFVPKDIVLMPTVFDVLGWLGLVKTLSLFRNHLGLSSGLSPGCAVNRRPSYLFVTT